MEPSPLRDHFAWGFADRAGSPADPEVAQTRQSERADEGACVGQPADSPPPCWLTG